MNDGSKMVRVSDHLFDDPTYMALTIFECLGLIPVAEGQDIAYSDLRLLVREQRDRGYYLVLDEERNIKKIYEKHEVTWRHS